MTMIARNKGIAEEIVNVYNEALAEVYETAGLLQDESSTGKVLSDGFVLGNTEKFDFSNDSIRSAKQHLFSAMTAWFCKELN